MLVHEFSVSPDEPADNGNTPLDNATATGSFECCLLLLGLGADPQTLLNQDMFNMVAMTGCRDNAGRPNDDNMEYMGGPRKIGELLRLISLSGKLMLELDHEATFRTESTPATVAQDFLNGRFRCELIDKQAESSEDPPDDPSFTPLQYALSISHYNSILALLELGADPNAYINEMPPLHLAVLTQQPALVALLLANGADPNLADPDGEHPIHQANIYHIVQFDVPDRVEIINDWEDGLLDVDVAADRQQAAETSAAQRLFSETESGDLERAPNRESITAMLYMLREAGANLEARDAKGQTAMMRAVAYDDIGTVETLKALGAKN